jgi:phosphatidylglycerophosphatase C
MTSSDTRRVVLFDLDGVLTRRDTFATLVTRRLRVSPWRLAAALPAVPLLALAGRWPERRGPVSRYLVRVALLGTGPAEARRNGSDLGAEFARTPEWLNSTVIDIARQHIASGDRVVVVTATEEQLARTLLDALDLTQVELVASVVAKARGGSGLRPHNYGRQKLRALLDLGLAPPWALLYTDSLADGPIADEAERVVLVDADAALLLRAQRRFQAPVVTVSGSAAP